MKRLRFGTEKRRFYRFIGTHLEALVGGLDGYHSVTMVMSVDGYQMVFITFGFNNIYEDI
jgi:hypothetical protein